MDLTVTILLLLVAVVISGPVARLTRMPVPLVQVALGAIIALSFIPTVQLSPDLFFLLFLPPLLFLDGWRIPKEDLFRDRAIVLELALGLVILTVLGLGWIIHLLIPAMPLPVAFALAAVIAPTDPIAVSAVAARTPIPKRMMHILEGESLLNDASGLVCMRFAVAAMLTGTFSLGEASLTFLWMALGGIAVGVALTWAVSKATHAIARGVGEDTSAQIVVSLLIPFGAYLLAEYIHCSGILAAVAAGITMTFTEQSRQVSAATRIRRSAVWDAVQFATNGVIFVLLGEQIPEILAGAPLTVQLTGHANPWWLGAYVLAIVGSLAALRLAWVWVSLKLTQLRARRKGEQRTPVSWRLVLAMGLAGVRGAITLAGVLTLPLTLADGSPFPGRDLAIFLAAGVILTTLVIASVILPRLLKGLVLPPEPSSVEQIDKAQAVAAQAAIQAIKTAQHELGEGGKDTDLNVEASVLLMEFYRRRTIDRGQQSLTAERGAQFERIERRLAIAALRAERDALHTLVRERTLEREDAAKIIRGIDLLEIRYGSTGSRD